MEAIFVDGGRQYRVKTGMAVDLDYRELDPGSAIEFPRVVAILGEGAESKLGQPYVEGAKVVARVLETVKGPKLVVTTFRRRKNSRKRRGHRQKYTRVRIEAIEVAN